MASLWLSSYIKLRSHPDEEIRAEARSALSELISADDLLLLLDALHQDDVNVQLNVLFLLRKIHDVQCLPYILPFFESENAVLREAAVTTLRYLNQVEQCQRAIALMSDPEVTVRCAAALTLGHLSAREAIPALCQAIASDSDWQVRKFALQALQKTLDQRTLPALIKALTDEYSDVRREAAIALGGLQNPAALNALQQALDDPDKDVCIYTQRAIQKIQESTQETSHA